MNTPCESDRNKPEPTESFDERISLLFEELLFASQQHRPSILLAFYESESVRDRAERALEERLAEDGQPLVPFRVDEKHFDIPLLLAQRLEGDRSVFSVTGLSQGGGKGGANAYRALNIRREYFVDYSIRVIVWLDPGEAIALSRHAPDFWAFRHRVVEFNDPPEPELSAREWVDPLQGYLHQPEQIDGQIAWVEAALANLPQESHTRTRRLELLFRLAGLYHAKKSYDRSIRYLQAGKQIARQADNTPWLAAFWGKLGLVYLDLDQPLRAVRACRKATRLNPREAGLWNNLGHFYHVEDRFSDAIIAYKYAIRLDPENSPARSALEACYRQLGMNAFANESK
jgi:tetratricopeptide (TPR) repeat protein